MYLNLFSEYANLNEKDKKYMKKRARALLR